jgi:lysine 2-monooxygenase
MTEGAPLDCVVIGGGVSGCYAAWRLAAAGLGETIALVERDSRLGGRLLSAPAGAGGPRIDFGAMRYRASQLKTTTLIENVLRLSVRALPLGKANRLYFLRGRLLDDSAFEVGSGEGLPYRSPERVAGLPPPQVLRWAIERVLSEVGAHGREAERWDPKGLFQGRPLEEWDFWNLMHVVLSTEGYYCALDGAGIGNGTVGRWNAAEAIPWFLAEFAPGSEYRLVNGGFDQVTTALGREFEACGGQILTRHELKSVERAEGSLLRAVLAHGGREKVLVTRRLVLALPPAALRAVVARSAVLESLSELIDSVTAQRLTRLILRYNHPWWTARHAGLSRLVTDLPVRQVTFGVEPSAGGAATSQTFVLCSFNDVRYPDFWSHLMNCSTTHRQEATSVPLELAADAPVVQEAHREITHALNVNDAPAPSGGWVVEWDHAPYGGGWHTWNAGSRPSEVMERLYQPIESLGLHVCGEAFSTYQAWVEGSLMSVDGLLQRVAGLPGLEERVRFVPEERLHAGA